jgi:hypothetical protein
VHVSFSENCQEMPAAQFDEASASEHEDGAARRDWFELVAIPPAASVS